MYSQLVSHLLLQQTNVRQDNNTGSDREFQELSECIFIHVNIYFYNNYNLKKTRKIAKKCSFLVHITQEYLQCIQITFQQINARQ